MAPNETKSEDLKEKKFILMRLKEEWELARHNLTKRKSLMLGHVSAASLTVLIGICLFIILEYNATNKILKIATSSVTAAGGVLALIKAIMDKATANKEHLTKMIQVIKGNEKEGSLQVIDIKDDELKDIKTERHENYIKFLARINYLIRLERRIGVWFVILMSLLVIILAIITIFVSVSPIDIPIPNLSQYLAISIIVGGSLWLINIILSHLIEFFEILSGFHWGYADSENESADVKNTTSPEDGNTTSSGVANNTSPGDEYYKINKYLKDNLGSEKQKEKEAVYYRASVILAEKSVIRGKHKEIKPSEFEKKLYETINKHTKEDVNLDDILKDLKNSKHDKKNLINIERKLIINLAKNIADEIPNENKDSRIYQKYKIYKTENDDEAMQLIEDMKLTQRHNNEIRRLLCGLEHDLADIIIEGDEGRTTLECQVTTLGSQETTLESQETNIG
ncbi:15095_t:CDS:2, partial [Racocetra fulgida]